MNDHNCEVRETSEKDVSFGYARGMPVSFFCPEGNISIPLSSYLCRPHCIDITNNEMMKHVASVPVFTGILLKDDGNSIKSFNLPVACKCEPINNKLKCKNKNST